MLTNPSYEYPTDIEDTVMSLIDTALGRDIIKTDYYAGELFDLESIMKLASQVTSFPHALVAVGNIVKLEEEEPAQQSDYQGETVSGTIFVCVSNRREFRTQHRGGLRYAYLVKAAIDGKIITPENSSEARIDVDSITEQVNMPGLCVYAVMFSIDLIHDDTNDN